MKQVLKSSRSPVRQFSPTTVVELFEAQVQSTPDAEALTDGITSLSYQQLNTVSNQLAHELMERGIGPKHWVGIFMERSIDAIVSLLATLKSGAGYLPMDVHHPVEQIQAIIEETRPSVVVTAEEWNNRLPECERMLVGGLRSHPSGAPHSRTNPQDPGGGVRAGPDDQAYIIFTSGSTGKPKGVIVEHGSLSCFLAGMQEYFPFGPGIRHAANTTLCFDISVLDIFGPLTRGGTIILVPDALVRDIPLVCRHLRALNANSLQATPSYWEMLVQERPLELPEIRCLTGGESLPQRLAGKILDRRLPLWNAYGPTETTIWCSAHRVTHEDAGAAGPPTVTIGRPLQGYQWYILDENLKAVPVGSEGEIYVSGDGLARGYLNRPGLTACRFVANPYSDIPGSRMYRTGDIGRWTLDGTVEFLGRSDFQVKIRGFRIELNEIEHVLGGHPGIQRAVVISRRDTHAEPYLAAYLIALPGSTIDLNSVRISLAKRLPEYMVPTGWTLLDEFPVTPNGKLDRSALPVPGRIQMDYEAPRDALERKLCELFGEVLGIHPFSRNGHFFQLGGDSLKAMRLLQQIRRQESKVVSLTLLFKFPTPAALSSNLDEGEEDEPELVARQNGRIAPLLHSQEGMWFIDELGKGSSEYNIPWFIRITGPLNPSVLQLTLQILLNRHESLRTRIGLLDGIPHQVIEPDIELQLPIKDWSIVSTENQDGMLTAFLNEESRAAFDLQTAPLIRFTLIRLGVGHHVLARTTHHFISDGRSEQLLDSEIAQLYSALIQDQPNPLPTLKIQFPDYCFWTRQRLTDQKLNRSLEYWMSQLRGMPEEVTLPLGRARSSGTGRLFDSVRLQFPPSERAAVQHLAIELGGTVYTVLLSAFSLLVGYYGGVADVPVGTAALGRDKPVLDSVVGYFVKTLVIRVVTAGVPSFSRLVAQTHAVVLEALDHQDVPFQKLVEALCPGGQPHASPLFQVFFNLNKADAETSVWRDCAVEPLGNRETLVRFDLELHVTDTGSGMTFDFLYDRRLFDRWRIEQFSRHFRGLLESACRCPHGALSSLLHLSPSDLATLLHDFNSTGHPWEVGSFVDRFREQVRRNPEAKAVEGEEAILTYGELDQQSNQLSRLLLSRGVRKGSIVAISLPRSPQLIVALLAVWKVGGVYMPMDPAYPAARLEAMIREAAPAQWISICGIRSPLDSGRSLLMDAEELKAEVAGLQTGDILEEERGCKLGAGDAAYIIYTSGSTGRPKGMVVPHRTLLNLMAWHESEIPAGPVAQSTSISFDVSLQEIAEALLRGQPLVIVGDEERTDAVRFARRIQRSGVAHIFAPQILLEHLIEGVQEEGLELPSLRGVYQAGEPLRVTPGMRLFFERHPDCRLHNHYGPAESHVATGLTLTGIASSWPSIPGIGRPVWNMTVLILTPGLSVAPLGVSGEIYLAGIGLAHGYLNQPARTAERFVANPFSRTPGSRMYRTGDLGRWRPDGTIEFLGRADQQVKIRGIRIELGEIEQVLLQIKGVGQAAVIARPAPTGASELAAYLVASPGCTIELEEVRASLGRALPGYMIPTGWAVLDALPITPNGKLDRHALPAPGVEMRTVEPPRTPGEEEVCRVFAEVLGLESVGRTDHFFRLGGHSLLAMRLMGRLREKFGGDPTVRLIFDFPSPSELALHLGMPVSARHPLSSQPRSGRLPLSTNQRSLWLADQVGDGSPEYNLLHLFELRGDLDLEALKRSLQALIDRHEALRTRFVLSGMEPLQWIASKDSVSLQVMDLQSQTPEKLEAELSGMVEREGGMALDLRTGPLIRFVLLREGEDRNFLLRICHHIVSDGWSEEILNSEMAVLYEAFSAGRPNPLPALLVHYADFSLWQRSVRSAEWVSRQLQRWTEYLAKCPQHLEWPADQPRPARMSRAGGEFIQHWSAEQLADIRRIAGMRNVTLFPVLLTLYAEVLNRHSGQNRLIIGSPSAGRLFPELEPLVGFFVNMLPIAVHLRPDASFVDQVSDVHQAVVWALEHQEIPLEQVVETLSKSRSPGIPPLFQTTFALQTTGQEEFNLRGMTWRSRPIAIPLVRFDLEVHVRERDGGLSIQWLYRRDLFDPARIEQFAQHFDLLARRACARPDHPLARHALLGPIEAKRLYPPSNPPAREPDGATVVDLFEDRVRSTPEAPAVIDAEGSLSYQQLNVAANKVAYRLIQEGIGPGTVVGVWAIRSQELIVGLLGILKSGAAYLPLDPDLPVGRLQAICKQARPLIILRPRIRGQAYPVLGAVEWDIPSSVAGSQSQDNPTLQDRHRCLTSDGAAYVVFTSGSTGSPKGVVAAHRGIVRLVRDPNYMRLGPTVRMLQLAPISFDAATLEIWGPLLNGGAVVLAPPGLLSLSDIARCLRCHQINTLWLSAGLFHAMVDAELESFSGLIQLLAGGDVLSPDHVRRFRDAHGQCRLINGYGPTEVTTFATCHTIPADVARDRPVPIGRPINETAVLLLDRSLNLLPVGMTGEIYLGGAGLALGYAGAPALTADRFVANPYGSVPGGRLYRTGDLGRWRPDGSLEFLGRSDQQVKIRGFRIELEEIEIALRQRQGVAQASVIAHAREAADAQLIAYIVPSHGAAVEWDEVRAGLAGKLPDYMIPSDGMLVDSLPLTPNGKVDRRSLPMPERDSGQQDPPRTPGEEGVCRAFAFVLNLDHVGRNDHFFRLGGNSLQAVRLIAVIQRDLGEELPVRSVLHHPTPAELARELAVARRRRVEGGSNPTVPFVVWCDAVPWSLKDWPADLALTGKSFPDFALEQWSVDHNSAYARLYCDHLRSTPPETPLFIGGFCRIGFIAFEAACQLADAGRPPAGVILLDSVPPSRIVCWARSIAVWFGGKWGASPGQIAVQVLPLLKLLTHAEEYLLIPRYWIEKPWKAIMRFASGRPSARGSGEVPRDPEGLATREPVFLEPEPRVNDANVYWQSSGFRCRRFTGPVVLLFSKETPASIRRTAIRRWSGYCPNLVVDETPGDHESCVRADAGALAAKMAQQVRSLFPLKKI